MREAKNCSSAARTPAVASNTLTMAMMYFMANPDGDGCSTTPTSARHRDRRHHDPPPPRRLRNRRRDPEHAAGRGLFGEAADQQHPVPVVRLEPAPRVREER